MKEILLTIDGKKVRAKEGTSVLEAARDVDIHIPSLCYHEKLKPYGACRICTVEIETRGRANLVAACVYPVEDNLIVITGSEKVIKLRKMLLELMLAYAPESKILQDLSQEYDVKEVRFSEEPSFCILCGLCVRYCAEIEKKNAIGFVGRGGKREIIFIPQIASKECPNCKRCFPLCPTDALQANFVLTQALAFPSLSTKSRLEE
jgi:NADH dehydrogenase/NADH:ubiquinone oxidoreductase subunit G